MNSVRLRPSGQKRSRNEASESNCDVSLSDQDTASTSASSVQQSAVPQKTLKSTTPHKSRHEGEDVDKSSSDERPFTHKQDSSTEESDSATEMLSDSVRRKKLSFVNKAVPSQPKRATPSNQKFTKIKARQPDRVFLLLSPWL